MCSVIEWNLKGLCQDRDAETFLLQFAGSQLRNICLPSMEYYLIGPYLEIYLTDYSGKAAQIATDKGLNKVGNYDRRLLEMTLSVTNI